MREMILLMGFATRRVHSVLTILIVAIVFIGPTCYMLTRGVVTAMMERFARFAKVIRIIRIFSSSMECLRSVILARVILVAMVMIHWLLVVVLIIIRIAALVSYIIVAVVVIIVSAILIASAVFGIGILVGITLLHR